MIRIFLFYTFFICLDVFAASTIPRFLSLKSDLSNLRVGPGRQYPVKIVYECINMPIEVIEESGNWFVVKDFDGRESWAHSSILKKGRFVIINSKEENIPLYRLPKLNARVLTLVKNKMIIRVKKCRSDWCLLKDNYISGWVQKDKILGVYKLETFG